MKKAVCVLTNNAPGISGHIEFYENSGGTIDVHINVKGLEPGLHGFHIHQTGDLRKGCSSLCSHFNPFGVTVISQIIEIIDILVTKYIGR